MSILSKSNGKNLTFADLRENLDALRNARVDVIVDSGDLAVLSPGALQTPYIEDAITAMGVGLPSREWELTPHAFRQWCAKMNVPASYLGRIADWGEHVKYSHLSMEVMNVHNSVEAKPLLLRCLYDEAEDNHICRAVLSPSYSFIENFDVLTAVFDGLRVVREEHGIGFEPGPASISNTHMRARVNMPQLQMAADELLKDYRSPWTGKSGTDNPTVFMGIEIRNSEVGGAAFTIVPVIIIQVCDNGMTLTKDIFRKVHLGSAMEMGHVSQRTMAATMELITAQTVDKVVEIGNPEFLQAKVDEFMELKRPVIPIAVQAYLKEAFDQERADKIFDDFITGGDISGFGVAQAITSHSQAKSVSADLAMEMDDSALAHAEKVLAI